MMLLMLFEVCLFVCSIIFILLDGLRCRRRCLRWLDCYYVLRDWRLCVVGEWNGIEQLHPLEKHLLELIKNKFISSLVSPSNMHLCQPEVQPRAMKWIVLVTYHERWLFRGFIQYKCIEAKTKLTWKPKPHIPYIVCIETSLVTKLSCRKNAVIITRSLLCQKQMLRKELNVYNNVVQCNSEWVGQREGLITFLKSYRTHKKFIKNTIKPENCNINGYCNVDGRLFGYENARVM